MKKLSSQDKMIIKVNENSIFYKIKKFFRNLFYKTNSNESINITEANTINNTQSNKSSFMESIKNIDNEETKLLKLQKQYRNGEIKEEELTEEQVNSLCALYNKQIEELRKLNEMKKQKLLEYRRKIQIDN